MNNSIMPPNIAVETVLASHFPVDTPDPAGNVIGTDLDHLTYHPPRYAASEPRLPFRRSHPLPDGLHRGRAKKHRKLR